MATMIIIINFFYHYQHHHDHYYHYYDCFNSHNSFFSIILIYQCFVISLYSVYLSLIAHTVSKLTLATNILKTLKLKSRIHLSISASEDSRRLAHTVSIDHSSFVFLELSGLAPVMHLDLFLFKNYYH